MTADVALRIGTAAVFLLVGVLLVILTAWVIALSLLHPPRMTDGKAMYVLRRMSPADIGLPYERISFDVRDEAAPLVVPAPDGRGDKRLSFAQPNAAEVSARLFLGRRREHERRIRDDLDRLRGAGRECIAREAIAHGDLREGGAGEAGGRAAFRVVERAGPDCECRNSRIESLEEGDSSRPVGHFDPAVVVLEKASARDDHAVRGGGCAHQGDQAPCTSRNDAGGTRDFRQKRGLADDRDVGRGIVRSEAADERGEDRAVTDVEAC